MKILSISAQKPDSTGSGVYLNELVKEFHLQGHKQAVVAGIYKEDLIQLPDGVDFYPLYFKSEEVPFAIAGMSDEMPYESTVYGQMTPEMVNIFEQAFKNKICEAVEEFQPDLIVCHHLYLVTSLTRELYPDKKICGFCHNTDLRQMKKIALRQDYIRKQIQKLDKIFALHEEQKLEIMKVYDVSAELVQVVGAGYNQHLFYTEEANGEVAQAEQNVHMEYEKKLRLIFAGKLSEKKGVISLLRSLSDLKQNILTKGTEEDKCLTFELALAGGYGREDEYALIQQLAKEAPYPVVFLGKLPQKELAEEYRKSDIFILPSFYEGLPMTVIEAMACGNRIVVTDLPGVRPWIENNVEHAPVVYVPMPEMKNTDEPVEESLPVFEKAVAAAVIECARMKMERLPNLSKVSWGTICNMVVSEVY